VVRQCFFEGGGTVEAEGLAGVDLEIGEEKGTSAVLIEVKAAPEVDRSGSATRGPRRRWTMSIDGFEDAPGTDSDKTQRGEVKGGAACFTRRGKRGEGERKERGVRHPFTGGSGEEWRHAVGGRQGGASGAWREGGPAVAPHERRSWVTVGRRCSVEQGSRGHRHVGSRP
jgi:hypothetical protein